EQETLDSSLGGRDLQSQGSDTTPPAVAAAKTEADAASRSDQARTDPRLGDDKRYHSARYYRQPRATSRFCLYECRGGERYQHGRCTRRRRGSGGGGKGILATTAARRYRNARRLLR